MSVAPVVRSRSRHHAFRSIRRQLLRSQRNLLHQAVTAGPSSTESELPADVLDLATCERDVALDDLMKQRACLKLQQVERALARLDDASYGMCHLWRTDIPLSRLRAQPDATLRVGCTAEWEDRVLLRSRA